MPEDQRERLRRIRTFPSLVKYLHDELDWPITPDDFEDQTFDFTPEEIGIDSKNAAKIQEIKRLRPLTVNQPWGVFFVKFEPKRLPVVALRRILNQVVLKKRASSNSVERAAWELDDLLFVSNYGDGDERKISFAHFKQEEEKYLPSLKVLGWDNLDTSLHLDHIAYELKEKLHWPSDEDNAEKWREDWCSAFTITHREVITTSKALAIRLAELARAIRDRTRSVLEVETEDGPVTKLMDAFKESLIHDLDEDDFADMYAQTITYGLLSARIANPDGDNTTDTFSNHLSVTNPFLRELMETFLHTGTGTVQKIDTGIDFDELGVSEVVDLLDNANMEAVVRDFGDRNPQEDPVIHFYELFLKEYDADKRMQRGVFYTPRPVVSFIVRSVDELLKTEFGLEDGLADTTTWGEMAERFDDLKIPEGATPDQAFVQILDPATGTGTFLVEVIDVIYNTMKEKWEKKHGPLLADVDKRWNEYVPKHLLPRLFGYELLMAPYAIAHMKMGLKLVETKYRFQEDERVRVYLTNSLEPAQDFSGKLEFAIPALAHEADAVNVIKQSQRFTVVIGNPPYANYGQNNKIPFILELLHEYKIGLDEKKINLDDDYIKFIRFAQYLLNATAYGVFGMITNNSFLDGVTHRRMRESLGCSYQSLSILNLHGSSTLSETCPDGTTDENVFDIRQGVGIALCVKRSSCTGISSVEFSYADLWGAREAKYSILEKILVGCKLFRDLVNEPPFFFFVPKDFGHKAEYDKFLKLTDVFLLNQTGIKTDRDALFFDFDRQCLEERIRKFYSIDGLEEPFRSNYRVEDSSSYKLLARRRTTSYDATNIIQCVYRPFDKRWLYYSPLLTSRAGYNVMRHMITGRNLGLITLRINGAGDDFAVICSDTVIEKGSLPRGNYSLFPLYVYKDEYSSQSAFDLEDRKYSGFTDIFLEEFLKRLMLCKDGSKLPTDLTHEDIFKYVYAIFHSHCYRNRYAEFLKIDFPRLPLTGSLNLFRKLAGIGGELVDLHLLASPKLSNHLTTVINSGDFQVEKVFYSNETVWIDKAKSKGFKGVPEEVWNFYIGGYQVCHKWLKDRQAKGGKNPRPGRILSDGDIEHYQTIVVALSETIRIMKEIDEIIEEHGGWPGAFHIASE